MNWEKTVMSDEEILEARLYKQEPPYDISDFRAIAKAQAEITWDKAKDKWAKELETRVHDAYKSGKLEGIREMVKWVKRTLFEEYETIGGSKALWFKENIEDKPVEIYSLWQAFLKGLGIDG